MAVMLNCYPASHTPDMKAVHYLTPVNVPELDARIRDYYNRLPQLEYVTGSLYRCCLYNSGMGWPTYAQRLLMAADSDGVAAWLYAACEADLRVGSGVNVHIREETGYPFDGAVRFTIDCDSPVSYPFYLRIPGWCKAFTLKVDGETVEVPNPNAILCIEREWQHNTVEIVFAQEIEIRRWAINGDCASISRGPLAYSLEIGEEWSHYELNGFTAFRVQPKSPWNYALDLSDPDGIELLETRKIPQQPWNNPDAPIVLGAKGRRLTQWQITDNMIDPVPQSPVEADGAPESIRLIPLGCARLRIGCFPVQK